MSRSAISKLADNLAALAKLPSVITKDAASDIQDAIEDSFNKGQDPYGRPWKAKKGGSPSYLQETEQMRESLEVKPMRGAGISIEIDEYPTVFHLYGTKKMVARPMLPLEEIPSSWAQAVANAFSNAMKRRKK